MIIVNSGFPGTVKGVPVERLSRVPKQSRGFRHPASSSVMAVNNEIGALRDIQLFRPQRKVLIAVASHKGNRESDSLTGERQGHQGR